MKCRCVSTFVRPDLQFYVGSFCLLLLEAKRKNRISSEFPQQLVKVTPLLLFAERKERTKIQHYKYPYNAMFD